MVLLCVSPPLFQSREVSPSTQRTPDGSHFPQENKSDNSSNHSSPEFPATKNRYYYNLIVN